MTPQLTRFLNILPARIAGQMDAAARGNAYQLYHGMHISLALGVALERTAGLLCQNRVIVNVAKYYGEYVIDWLTAHADSFVTRPDGSCGWEIRDERSTQNGEIQQLSNVRIGCGLAYLVRAMDRCGISLGSAEPIRQCLADALSWRMKADAAFVEDCIHRQMNDKAAYLAAWMLIADDATIAEQIVDAWYIPREDGFQLGDRRVVPPYGSWSTQKCGAEVLMLLELFDGFVGAADPIAQQFDNYVVEHVGEWDIPGYSKYPDGSGGTDHQWCDPSLWFMHPMLRHEARECNDFIEMCEKDQPKWKDDPTAKALWGDGTRLLIAACAI